MPGAFTGTCSKQVPGYIKAYEEFKAKGVDNIYIVAVNDAFVTKAWKEHLHPRGRVSVLLCCQRPHICIYLTGTYAYAL